MKYKTLASVIKDMSLANIQENVMHDRYMRAHGKKAQGSGMWAFTTKRMGDPSDNEMHIVAKNTTLTDAAKEARKALNNRNIYVMEETQMANIDEQEKLPTGVEMHYTHSDAKKKPFKVTHFSVSDAQRGQKEYGKMGYKLSHKKAVYAKEDMDLENPEAIAEKKLTPAEMKKREEVAKAIERDEPKMAMDKKMAIATATAKRVAEENNYLDENNRAHNDGFNDGQSGKRNPRASSIHGPNIGHYEKGYAAGGQQAKQQKSQNVKKYKDSIAPYMKMSHQELKSTEDQIRSRHKKIIDTPHRDKTPAMSHEFKTLARRLEDIHQAKFQRDKIMKKEEVDLDEAFKKGDSVKITNARRYDALSKPTVSGTVIGMQGSKVMVQVGRGQMNVDVKDLMKESAELDEARGGADEPDKHIIMQLRSAQDLDGNKEIRFRGGKTAKVPKKHIDKILKLHDHPSMKPVNKRVMRVAISKSPLHLSRFADQIKENFVVEQMDPIFDYIMSNPSFQLYEAPYKVPSNYTAMMQKKKKQDVTQQMADKAKKDNMSQSDKDKLGKLSAMMKKEATDKEIKMAKGVAFDKRYKGGNYTGAAKTIEKIRKGLSDHPSVKSALRRANENVEAASMLDEKIKLKTKVTMHHPGKDYHGKTGHVGEIRHGAHSGAPKTYTIDYDNGKSVQLGKSNIKMHRE